MPGGFQFPLQRVMDWEEQMLRVEVAAQSRIQSDIYRLDQLGEAWKTELATQQDRTLATPDLTGKDLHRLTEYRATLQRELAKVPQVRAHLVENLNVQRQKVVAQNRKLKTLARLNEKQRQEWLAKEQTKETELASELFLASLIRTTSA